jgi:soluble lytic murein transglycosylase-like protein
LQTAGSRQADDLQRQKTLAVVVFLFALPLTFPATLNSTKAFRWRQVSQVSRPAAPSASQAIEKWAQYYRVDKALAVRIAHAESGLDCKVQNKNSSAGGLFQFTNSTFLNTQKELKKPQDVSKKFDCDENAELGIYLLSKGELHHWDASRSAWDPSWVAEPELTSSFSTESASD